MSSGIRVKLFQRESEDSYFCHEELLELRYNNETLLGDVIGKIITCLYERSRNFPNLFWGRFEIHNSYSSKHYIHKHERLQKNHSDRYCLTDTLEKYAEKGIIRFEWHSSKARDTTILSELLKFYSRYQTITNDTYNLLRLMTLYQIKLTFPCHKSQREVWWSQFNIYVDFHYKQQGRGFMIFKYLLNDILPEDVTNFIFILSNILFLRLT
jgi:hypothetical protein